MIKSIFQFFVFSNLFVAFCALALCLSSEIILGAKNHHLSIFVFFATIFTYNFQRIVRLRKGIKHTRKYWLEKNRKKIIYLLCISIVVAYYYFFSFNFNTQVVIVICGILSLLYPFGIRKIPFLKIFIISITWAIATFLLLVIENGIMFDFSTAAHFVIRLFFIFSITIPFDIRDLPYDNPRLKTLPILLGELNARILAVFCLILAQIACLYLFFIQSLTFNYLMAISISFLITSIFILKSKRNNKEMYFSFWIESLSIIFYIILVLSSCMV